MASDPRRSTERERLLPFEAQGTAAPTSTWRRPHVPSTATHRTIPGYVAPEKGQGGGRAEAVIFGHACGNLVCNDKYAEQSSSWSEVLTDGDCTAR